MSIEQLKKKLESERVYLNSLTMTQGGPEHTYINRFDKGYELATNRLLPLLEKAVEVIKIYGEELEWDGVNNPAYIQDRGKIARKFLTEIKKEFGE